jgi:hypothetical protein
MRYPKRFARLVVTGIALTGALSIGALSNPVLSQNPKRQETKVKGDRDPFVKYKPPAPAIRQVAGQMMVPPVQERINSYKAMKAAAMSAQQPAPKPTMAFLLSEVQITGIFRTPRGYAAMVEATPISLSYVIYPGEQFFDGQLVAIEEDKLIFRHETRLTNGKKEMAVLTKPLRRANAVAESMAVTNAPAPKAPATTTKETAPDGSPASPNNK